MLAQPLKLETPRSVEVVQVVRVVAARGHGNANDPIREVTQYWSPDGKLLAEYDSEVVRYEA